MQYMGDKTYWDDKFIARSNQLLPPEQSLVDNIRCLKKGSVLDVACGDGRNALYLLQQGFHVTGIDFSEEALRRLEQFAKSSNYHVNIQKVDLSERDALEKLGLFDNIIINHYRLKKSKLLELEKHMVKGAVLFVCGFGHKHKVDDRIKDEDLIQSEDFEKVRQKLELVSYEEKEDERGCFVTYIFKKR